MQVTFLAASTFRYVAAGSAASGVRIVRIGRPDSRWFPRSGGSGCQNCSCDSGPRRLLRVLRDRQQVPSGSYMYFSSSRSEERTGTAAALTALGDFADGRELPSASNSK